MATINDTKKAIKAVPEMIADCTEGEWRVTVTLDSMKAAYPGKGATWWAERREAIAHYTNDSEDALATAKSMSASWAQEKAKAMATENNTTPARERAAESELQAATPAGYVVLSIPSTGNAAFADMGRTQEIARIVGHAADKIEGMGLDDCSFPVHDVNGNRVGEIAALSQVPQEAVPEGGLRLAIEIGHAAFVDEPLHEVSRILRDAAGRIGDGVTDFQLHDANGNNVGRYQFVPLASLEKDGRIDMDEALKSGNVYLADDGFSGIADGEYRYVVPAEGFEPGYHQGQGDAWLVNAKGDVAPGYEEPQTVQENAFRQLNASERAALLEVVEGRVTFEDFERTFEDEDLAP